MKWITLLALILGPALALPQDRSYESQVVQADVQLNELIKKNEPVKAASFYADETGNVTVRVLDSTAVLTGKLHQKGSYKGQAFDVFVLVTDTWVKTDSGWKLLAGHATLLPSTAS